MKTLVAALLCCGLVCVLAIPAMGEENQLPASMLKILSKAEQIELLALEPEKEKETPKNHFHGYTVRDKALVKNAAARKDVIESLTKGMEGKIDAAKCFEPRHGIRATHDGKTVELVICFACSQFYAHELGGDKRYFLIDQGPMATLDKLLKESK